MSNLNTIVNLEELLALQCSSIITIVFEHESSHLSSAQIYQEVDVLSISNWE